MKISFQNRARESIPLVRLDMGGGLHTNPDRTVVSQPHLHIYREGEADAWAVPAPRDIFANLDNLWITLYDFMEFCRIVKPPHFRQDQIP